MALAEELTQETFAEAVPSASRALGATEGASGRDQEGGPTISESARLAAAKNARSRSLSSGRRTVRRSTFTWWRSTAFSS